MIHFLIFRPRICWIFGSTLKKPFILRSFFLYAKTGLIPIQHNFGRFWSTSKVIIFPYHRQEIFYETKLKCWNFWCGSKWFFDHIENVSNWLRIFSLKSPSQSGSIVKRYWIKFLWNRPKSDTSNSLDIILPIIVWTRPVRVHRTTK